MLGRSYISSIYEYKTYIFSSRVTIVARHISRSIWTTAYVLGAVETSPDFIAQVDMDIRDMNDLNWSFPADCRSLDFWLDGHRYCVRLNSWPLTQAENSQAEELRCTGADGHDPEVVG